MPRSSIINARPEIRMLAVAVAFLASIMTVQADEWHFSDVQRVVAISDVHGAFSDMVLTLRSAGIIDKDRKWIGDQAHLVITGDLLDRGPDSRRVIDMIMRLEKEAITAGGRLHLLLGNHEVMNMIGDIRYVADAEFAAFSSEESADEREYWYQHFRQRHSRHIDETTIRAAFEEKAPPGFFGHRRALSLDGIYARWLLEKPLIIVINDTAYVHGGLSSYVAKEGIGAVNNGLKSDLREYMTALTALQDGGVLSPIDRFRDQHLILAAGINAGSLGSTLVAAANVILNLKDSPLHRPRGPLWYRGSSVCSEVVEGDVLDAALLALDAKRVVIGHTTTKSRQVQERLSGRVIEINTGMLESSYGGTGQALVVEAGMLSVVSEDGTDGLSPISPARRVGKRPDGLDDVSIANILLHGNVLGPSQKEPIRTVVHVSWGVTTVSAILDSLPREDGFAPELAAYRLDKILGLDMVPVTIRRDIAGQQSTLQLTSLEALSELDRVADHKAGGGPCPVDRQLNAMRVFDALIGNPVRTAKSMLYEDDDWQLTLVDHSYAFGVSKGEYEHDRVTGMIVGDEWRKALLDLDDIKLRSNLRDVLTKERLDALSERRDELVLGSYTGRSSEENTDPESSFIVPK